MSQVLRICRVGTEWAFRDVTGAEYAHSSDINFVIEAAHRLAERTSAQVVFSVEAEHHYRDLASTKGSVETRLPASAKSSRSLRSLVARLVWWRRTK